MDDWVVGNMLTHDVHNTLERNTENTRSRKEDLNFKVPWGE
jgi:hypothetical protein